jgi:periplasmic copper chaperone A
MRHTALLRAGLVALAGLAGLAAAVVVEPAVASAHVTVSAEGAVPGGQAKMTVRVPNERDDVGTVKVQLLLPAGHPMTSVSVRPTPGWSVTTEEAGAVSAITWTAGAGAAIPPGAFQEFDVVLGPLPHADRLVFHAVQTYADGQVVNWSDEGATAEHPAPTLPLAPAAAHLPADTAARDAAATMTDGARGTDGTVISLGLAALLVGLAALTAGVVARRRVRADRG